MLSMQQSSKTSRAIEESVGEAIAAYRAGRGVTQRQLAADLTAAGMPVDASAVSRIEKGTRSIRLTEAITIANILDVDLDLLVDGVRTPNEELKRVRRNTDVFMSHLDEPFMLFMSGVLETKWLLEANPQLVESLRDEEFGAPNGPSDYVRWCGERVARLQVDPDSEVLTRTQEEASELLSLMLAWASNRVHADPDLQETANGKHPEA
jgi:transcriptional regulator with XRE-family HTH domain